MAAITSRFLNPPEEQEFARILDGIESAMSALYGVQTTLATLTRKSQASGLNLADAGSVVQHGKNELFEQCERISKVFEDLSAQAQAYKILGLSNFESRGIYLEKSTQEAQSIIGQFRAIVNHQTGTVKLLQKLSKSLGEHIGDRPEGGKRNSMPREGFTGSPSESLSPTTAWSRRFSLDVAKLQGKQTSHLKEIYTHLNEGIKASTQVLVSLKALDSYYSLYLDHLRSSVPSPRVQDVLNMSSDIVQRNDISHDFVIDLQRMEVVWTRYQEVVTEAVIRLLRVADTVGTSRPTPVVAEPLRTNEVPSQLSRPLRTKPRSQTMPDEHTAAIPSEPHSRSHPSRSKTVPAITPSGHSGNPRKSNRWWKWSGWAKFKTLWSWFRPSPSRRPTSSA